MEASREQSNRNPTQHSERKGMNVSHRPMRAREQHQSLLPLDADRHNTHAQLLPSDSPPYNRHTEPNRAPRPVGIESYVQQTPPL